MSSMEFYLKGRAEIKEGVREPDKKVIYFPEEKEKSAAEEDVAVAIDRKNRHCPTLNAVGCTIYGNHPDNLIRYAALTFGNWIHRPDPSLKERTQGLGVVMYNASGRAIEQNAENIINFLKLSGKKLKVRGNQDSVELWSPEMLKAYQREHPELARNFDRTFKEAADEVAFGVSAFEVSMRRYSSEHPKEKISAIAQAQLAQLSQ